MRSSSTARSHPGRVRRHLRWGPITGTLAFAYAVFFAIEVATIGFDPRLYTRIHQIQGNAVSRAVLAVVVLAGLFHGLNGLRITLVEMSARLARHAAGLQTAVQFLTFAVGVPSAFVILWPSVWELFA
ncbi:MAG: hypothetical protein HYX32_13575 [Actinobacteria bacterium]|nr:hypothetical protein [Actinomycetota bacterium]